MRVEINGADILNIDRQMLFGKLKDAHTKAKNQSEMRTRAVMVDHATSPGFGHKKQKKQKTNTSNDSLESLPQRNGEFYSQDLKLSMEQIFRADPKNEAPKNKDVDHVLPQLK